VDGLEILMKKIPGLQNLKYLSMPHSEIFTYDFLKLMTSLEHLYLFGDAKNGSRREKLVRQWNWFGNSETLQFYPGTQTVVFMAFAPFA